MDRGWLYRFVFFLGVICCFKYVVGLFKVGLLKNFWKWFK